MSQQRALIFAAIVRERTYQDEQWGGETHDDAHDLFEWCEYIRKQNNYAVSASHVPQVFEARMVRVAALALAAIESSQRQRGVPPENGESPNTPVEAKAGDQAVEEETK